MKGKTRKKTLKSSQNKKHNQNKPDNKLQAFTDFLITFYQENR